MPNLDDVLKRYSDYGKQSQAPLPPPSPITSATAPGVPQYTIPNAFQTPRASMSMYKPMSSQNDYEAQVSMRFAGQSAMYHDPSSAAGNMSGRQGRQFGNEWGSTIGAAMSMVPAPGAIAAGIGVGMFGGGIGAGLGRVGGAVGSMFSDTRQQQASYMHMTTGVQQGTQGHLMLGGGQSGLGGSGMNMQAAGGLAQKLGGLGKQEGMNNQEMLNLTRSAGELNFLDNATNTDQMFETIKKLTKVVGVMGKITGDPDIMRNLKEIANLRSVGLNIDQAVQATQQIDMAARGMGMDRFQAMTTAGAAGMSVFQSAGMTGGVGMVQGVGAGAMARMGSAGLDERQLALAGGVPGLTNTFMQQNARFAQGAGGLQMMSGLTRGGGGEFGLEGGFAKGLMGGGSFAGRLQSGLSNVRSPADLIQFLGQQKELQTEMMEQMGPFGAQLSQAQLIADVAKQMGGKNQRESTLMAASLVTGSPEQGLTLMRTLGSKEFGQRAGAAIDEQERRIRHEGALGAGQERSARNAARTQRQRRSRLGAMAPVGRGAMEWMAEAVGILDEEESRGTVGALDEAMQEEQEAQDRQSDEAFEQATGLSRTTRRAKGASLARPVEREIKRAKDMMKAGWKISGLSKTGKELGGLGVDFEFDEKTKTVRVKPGKHFRIEVGGLFGGLDVETTPGLTGAEITAADMFMGDDAATSGVVGGALDALSSVGAYFGSKSGKAVQQVIQGQRQQVQKRIVKTGQRIQDSKRMSEKAWHRDLRHMAKTMGGGGLMALNKAAVDYAKSLDGTNAGVDGDTLFKKMVGAFATIKGITHARAAELLEPQRKELIRTGMKFISKSGDPAALGALVRSEEAAGIVDVQGMSVDALNKFSDSMDARTLESMEELGFASEGAEDMTDVSDEQRASFDAFRELSPEDQALSMGILAQDGGVASAGVSEELGQIFADAPKRYDRIAKAARKMKAGLKGKKERDRLVSKAGGVKSLKGLTEELIAGGKGTGRLRGQKAAHIQAIVDEEMERRGDKGVSHEGEGATGVSSSEQKQLDDLKEQRKQLDALPKLLGEFPDAVKSFKSASDALVKIVGGDQDASTKANVPQPQSIAAAHGLDRIRW